jgi:4'-phosphopantetheinyl transferase
MKNADMDLARRFFSASERSELEACGENGKIGLFFGFWTLKESYLKAIGKGLTVPLESFSMRLSEEGITAAAPEGRLPFFFRRYFLDEKHALSACATSGNFPVEAERMDHEYLVRRFLSRPP